MGWLERLFRPDAGVFGVHHEYRDGGAEFRQSIMRESQERERRRRLVDDEPMRPNSTWRWTGDRWQQWSVLGLDYEDVDQTEVPTTLLDEIASAGVTPAAGDRFRFIDDTWTVLDPGEPDRLPPEPD